jgi:hypothetical protein
MNHPPPIVSPLGTSLHVALQLVEVCSKSSVMLRKNFYSHNIWLVGTCTQQDGKMDISDRSMFLLCGNASYQSLHAHSIAYNITSTITLLEVNFNEGNSDMIRHKRMQTVNVAPMLERHSNHEIAWHSCIKNLSNRGKLEGNLSTHRRSQPHRISLVWNFIWEGEL